MKPDASKVLAANVKRLIEEEKPDISREQLAKNAGMAGNSIYYMIYPECRPPNRGGTKGSSTVGQIEKVASLFNREPWQLLLNEETLGKEMFTTLFYRPLERKKPALKSVGGNKDEPFYVANPNLDNRAKDHVRRRKK